MADDNHFHGRNWELDLFSNGLKMVNGGGGGGEAAAAADDDDDASSQ